MPEFNQDSEQQKEFNEAYNMAWAAWGDWQAEARRDGQALSGDIFTSDEQKQLKLRNSDLLNIQLIRPIINWVAGFQADHRKGIKYDPIEGGDVETANDFTELGTAVLQRNKGYNVITKGFKHAVEYGLALVDVFNDTNQNTKLQQYFYNQFLLDPAWTKLDLSDCNFMIMRKYVTKEEARILLPDSFNSEIAGIDDERSQVDDKFPNLITPVQYGHKMFAYDQFQQRHTIQKIIIIIKPTGVELEWEGTQKELNERLPALLQANNVPAEMVTTITRTEPTVKVSAFLNSKHVATEIDPFGIGDYSATPIQCFYNPEMDQMKWKLQGMVRSLKDIQRAETKRIISMIAWYENSIANGLDFEENTLVDEEDAFKTGIGPRKFKEGALSGEKVRDRENPPLPGGMLELHNLLTDLMPKTVNVNPDMMGLPPDANRAQISGLLSELRIGSGMVGLRGLFDDLSQSQNIIGRKMLKLYQQYPMEKVKRMLGREPSPQFKDKKFADFDAATAEGVLTDTQKNAQYQEMLTLMEMGQKIGKPFPAEWVDVLELGTLQISRPMMDKIKQREKAASESQQKAAESQQQVQDVTIELLKSQAAQSRAKATESPSNVAKNMTASTLNQAKSVQSITAAELNEAKSGGAEVDIDNSLLNSAIELRKLGIEEQKLLQPTQSGAVQ